jgi:hypothetical protein
MKEIIIERTVRDIFSIKGKYCDRDCMFCKYDEDSALFAPRYFCAHYGAKFLQWGNKHGGRYYDLERCNDCLKQHGEGE